jgi:nucleoside 2-deoxyribosyltransferase
VLARDKEFHDDLYPNIQTYLHGCGFGIAVFERLESEEFNPNVALEVGYMFGLRKHVLLLKDRTLRALQTDLVGKLYREFDPQNPEETIPAQIDGWLSDKDLA